MNNEVILLRGLFRGSQHWGNFPRELQNLYPNWTVTCIDIPGNGYLSAKSSPKTISDMVESIRNQRRNKSKVHILAVSMGGMIGLKWAELYPDEVESLICVNTSAKGFSPFYQRLLPRNYYKIFKALISMPYEREKIIYEMVSNRLINLFIINKWADYSEKYPMTIRNFFRQLLAANNFVITQPQCDLHFIASLNDRLVSVKATTAIAKAWNIPPIINDNDGHDIALDNPEWLLNIIHLIWYKINDVEFKS
ncbi:alpha/beta fold hydrolase [Photobacterium damselae]|uniref:alpha/beta fold hydrolase n=1 Tax=Photobacterium damselae TaxID=38293 RepID=UPI001F188C2B|nr:alpha/beta hydrolase [Photobacterium damselae]UKA11697.1 alpha/beta hydrolase [Photobacterium damselae subsp. damselae]